MENWQSILNYTLFLYIAYYCVVVKYLNLCYNTKSRGHYEYGKQKI